MALFAKKNGQNTEVLSKNPAGSEKNWGKFSGRRKNIRGWLLPTAPVPTPTGTGPPPTWSDPIRKSMMCADGRCGIWMTLTLCNACQLEEVHTGFHTRRHMPHRLRQMPKATCGQGLDAPTRCPENSLRRGCQDNLVWCCVSPSRKDLTLEEH